jgi:3-methyl-2-oxobutanoate hydroxymethyltransferase
MLGLTEDYLPKFVKQYAKLAGQVRSAIKDYVEEVQGGQFPSDEHCYK